MKNKVLDTILSFDMLNRGDSVTVGLSGGADSVCLLLMLKELKDELGLKSITACHINHCLRGEDSEADETFCRELCKSLDIPLTVYREDINAISKERKIGLEQCGRQVRYERFSECGKIIATAHNSGDNAETVLFNLTRGSALSGLCGIPAVNYKNDAKIIRPLINVTRDEIEQYLKSNSQDFVTDKTNFDTIYNRNIIRLNVIPELKKINPSFESAVLRMNESVKKDNDFLYSLAETAMENAKIGNDKYDCALLAKEPDVVLSRICTSFLWNLGIDPTREKIGYITDAIKNGDKVSIGFGWFCDGKNNELSFYNESDFNDFSFPLKEGILSLNKGKQITITLMDRKTFISLGENEKNYLYHTLDYDKILSKAEIRNRRDGDKVKLHGRSFTQKIKKLFCEFVPLEKRDATVLIADSEGVIFVEGFGTSERTRVTKDSQKILYIDIKE